MLALMDGSKRITYREVERRANQVAYALTARGATRDAEFLDGICWFFHHGYGLAIRSVLEQHTQQDWHEHNTLSRSRASSSSSNSQIHHNIFSDDKGQSASPKSECIGFNLLPFSTTD
jgi:hypothetical protein